MKRLFCSVFLITVFSFGVWAQVAEPDARLTTHAWTWHNDVPNGRDHVSVGRVPFVLAEKVGFINLRQAYLPEAQPYVFVGFPRVKRNVTSDNGATVSVDNIFDGLINANGKVIFAGSKDGAPSGTATLLSSCNGIPMKLPVWDVSFGVTASPGDDCTDGDHTVGDWVELLLRFSGSEESLVKVTFVADNRLRVETHPNAVTYWRNRFATGGRLGNGEIIEMPQLGNFYKHYSSGLLTTALDNVLMGKTMKDPPVLVLRIHKNGMAGDVGVVIDEIVLMLGNAPGDNDRFSKTLSK